MKPLLPLVLCGFLAELAGGVWAEEPDPTRAKLDGAVKIFSAQQAKFREGVVTHFETRETAVRNAGNKKMLDELKVERKQFDDKGMLPRSTPTALRQSMLTAIAKVEAAYELAIKEYTKVKKDTEATAVERESNAFKRQIERFESRLDAFQIDTVWKGNYAWVNGKDTGKSTFDVQVVERDGKSFKVALTYHGNFQAEGAGTIEKGKLEWKPQGAKPSKETRLHHRLHRGP